jgi:hypothetical protein
VIDYDRFVRSHVAILNEGGTRGYDQGIRTFDCPFCGDTKGRGWVGEHGAGCFNTGCEASPTLPGGLIGWAGRILRKTRGEAYRYLVEHFSTKHAPQITLHPRGEDWCRLPAGTQPFDDELFGEVHPSQVAFERFMRVQWGLSREDAHRWDLGWTTSGRHSQRVVIPIHYRTHLVGFQTRSITGAQPKYLTSQHGPEADPQAECGRPANALLFNADAIQPGKPVVLVEGAGDVMGWRHPTVPAVAVLGTALTAQKIKMLQVAHPTFVVVALDAESEAQVRAAVYLADLRSGGLLATQGAWIGGKDAGSGAALVYNAPSQDEGSSRTEMLKSLLAAQ